NHSFRSRKDGDWGDPCTWNPPAGGGGCGTLIPAVGDRVEITHDVSVISSSACGSLKLSGSVTGDGPLLIAGPLQAEGARVNVPITVQGATAMSGDVYLGRALTTRGVAVDGTLAGPSYMILKGASDGATVFTNNGSVSLDALLLGANGQSFRYGIAGNGSWDLKQVVQFSGSGVLEVTGTATMTTGSLAIPEGAELS